MVFELVRDRWAQLLSAILGLWLMAAPDVLGYGKPASTIHHILGPVAAAFAIVALWGHLRPLRWIHPFIGLLLIVVPPVAGVLGGDLVALENSVIVGLVLVVLGFVGEGITESYGGGWTALWTGDVLSVGTNEGVDLSGDRFRN